MAAREDFRQRLTNALTQSLEEHGRLPWQRERAVSRPFNPASGVKYKGGNVMGLILEQLKRGSGDPRWMTLKQANKAGYSIRKGAKAAYVEYWDWGVPGLKLSQPKGAEAAAEDDETEEQVRARTKARVFYAAVFNGEDVVGLPEMVREQDWNVEDLVDRLVAATGAEIEHDEALRRAGYGAAEQGVAYYSRSADKIVSPPKSAYKTVGDYCASVLHELALWTGHPSRLNRPALDERAKLSSPAYAREKLRVEMASFLLKSMLGVEEKAPDPSKQAATWFQQAVQGDKHELFRAARDAEQIVDHIFGYAPELRDIVEGALVANTLPEDGPKRRVDIGISDDVPNFIPAGAKPAEPTVRTGRADPRWKGFEQALHETAKKAGLNAEAVMPVFDMIEPNFTTIMDGMKKSRGLDEDMVYQMIGAQIIDEMKQADVHHKSWDDFASKVRTAAQGVEVEVIESVLQETNRRYQQVLVDGVNNRWDTEKTLQELNAVLYGKDYGAVVAIDAAFVQAMVQNSAVAKTLGASPAILDDDDVLEPLGMSEVMPDDAGISDDERIARMSL